MNMPQNVDEMCAENKTSMNRPQNVEEMSAENKTSMNNATKPGETDARTKKKPPEQFRGPDIRML